MFVKRENTNLSAKPDAVPRAICPRSPRYLAAFARFIKPIESRLYAKIDELWGDVVVAKGKNAVDRAAMICRKFNSFKRPVAIGADATRFDQHVGKAWLKWERSLYTSFYAGQDAKECSRLMSYQLVNILKAVARDPSIPDKQVRVDARIDGHRMSGDPNTSLGNTLIMSTMCYLYSRTKSFRIEYINDGDDCVFFMEQDNEDEFRRGSWDWFLNLGFRMEFEETVKIVEQVEFCQARPVLTASGWIMSRNIWTHRSKDITSFKPQNPQERLRWVHAVATGGVMLAAGMPVSQAFYQALGRLVPAPKRGGWVLERYSGLGLLSANLGERLFEITPLARASFSLAWDMTVSQQLIAESMYQRAEYLPCPLEPSSIGGDGVATVRDPKSLLGAKQNAERLHGVRQKASRNAQSESCLVSHTTAEQFLPLSFNFFSIH